MSDTPPQARLIRLPHKYVRSLVWDGDILVDWAGGGVRFDLNGGSLSVCSRYAYTFDAAVADGDHVVVYTRFGTKGLAVAPGRMSREINRSYYHADAYDYPIAIFRLNDGRRVIAHCPDEYNCLEIEDFETGERLTSKTSRKPSDFFHSRLSVSPSGRYLMSAGWVWQPMDVVHVYDIAEALMNNSHLDGGGIVQDIWSDDISACWTPEERLIVSRSRDDDDNPKPELKVYDAKLQFMQTLPLQEIAGQIMPLGRDYLLNLYDYPRLIDLKDGAVVQTWPEIPCGSRTSSICTQKPDCMPVVASDPHNRRCAIATEDEIFVLMFAPT